MRVGWPRASGGTTLFCLKGIAMFQKLRTRIALAVLLLAISVGAYSSFHEWRINEVYSNASGTLQFIELTTTFSGQEFLTNRQISSSQGGPANVFTFLNDLPSGTAGKKFLIGTAGVAAASGVTPDYIIPDGFIFTSNVTINFAGVDSVAYMSLPTDGTLSVNSTGATATNSPTNFAGTTGTVVVTNPTPPGPPTMVSALAGNAQLTISFTPGSSGSSPITSFNATCGSNFGNPGMALSPTSPIVVAMLSNGQPYLCSLNATNAAGTGPSASVSGTPFTVPGAPTINFVSAGDGSATINFNPPASNGGAAISGYTANCGTGPVAGAAPAITVSPLTNGTTYSCTVAAVNSAGTGPQSSAVSVTPAPPATPPGMPAITGTVPGNGQATISFTTPADGGSPITNYRVNCAPGPVSLTGTLSPIIVTGLTNGTTYSCTVTANNGIGASAASTAASVIPFTVPAAPTIGAATPANTAASIAFTPPASTGGSVITGYTATCNPGPVSAPGANSPINLSGLVNGTVYSCSVTARNAAGTGPASAGVGVVPATLPGAPTIGTPVAGDGRGAVFFTPPMSNGGSPVVSYTATCGAFSATGPASPITVTGLTNNNIFACSVIATNAVGNSVASASASVTPSTFAPLTPIAVVARKIHGGAGTFDLPVDTTPTAVTVEPRTIGNGHTIVFQFNVPIKATGTVTVAPVGTVSATIAGDDVVVTLTNITDNQRATISLANVNGAGVNVSAAMGFLTGDVNNSRSVSATDISGVKARVGQATTGSNFRFDVNASGVINPVDISAVKARSGLVLP